jgi:hypothetical protein
MGPGGTAVMARETSLLAAASWCSLAVRRFQVTASRRWRGGESASK